MLPVQLNFKKERQHLGKPQVPTRNLDFLRMFAVLLVVLNHLLGDALKLFDLGYGFPRRMGRLGVMIFFVHTSLVLMLSMERMTVGGWRMVRSFYLRRAFRLYPLSIVAVLVVSFFAIPDPYSAFHPISSYELLSNLSLTQNLTGARSVIGPLWSLPWEVQMYLALPFLFFGVNRRGITLVAAVTLLVMGIDAAGVSTGHRLFRIVDYVPCFMGGVIAYALMKIPRVRIPAFLWPVAVMALTAGWLGAGAGWPLRKVFYSEWILCLLLGLLIPRFRDLEDGILASTSHIVAKYSYGIYLFHFIAIWLTFDRFGWIGTIASTVTSLAVTAAISFAGYHLIEEPMIRLGKRLCDDATPENSKGVAIHATG